MFWEVDYFIFMCNFLSIYKDYKVNVLCVDNNDVVNNNSIKIRRVVMVFII